MNKPMGVMMLVNEFPPLPVGGGELQAERLARKLAESGLQVCVITRGAKGLARHAMQEGFLIRRIAQPGWGKLKSLTFILGALWMLLRYRREYDVLHAHLAFSPAIAAVIAGRLLGTPVVIKYGNSGVYGDIQSAQATRRGRLKLALFRQWADAHIALDQDIAAELQQAEFPLERVRMLINGVDTRAFVPSKARDASRARLGLEGKTLLLFVGRLTPQKSLPTLLEAFHHIAADFPQGQLVLLGEGPDRKALEEFTTALHLEGQVSFVGNVADVRPYLQAADLFVLPSLSEGVSNALLEAMASGVACVVTRVGGAEYLLDGGACGTLIPPKDPDALADALRSLLNDSAERDRLGRLARLRAQEYFDITMIAQQYQNLYTELLWRRTK